MKIKSVLALIAALSMLMVLVIVPTSVIASDELFLYELNETYEDLCGSAADNEEGERYYWNQKIKINYPGHLANTDGFLDLIDEDAIQVDWAIEDDTARWKRIGLPNLSTGEYQWETVMSPPDNDMGWLPNYSGTGHTYSEGYFSYLGLAGVYRDKGYERLSATIYINDEDIPLGYDLDSYEIEGTALSDYNYIYDKYEEKQDNQLGPIFFDKHVGDTDVTVHLKEVTPWVSSSFEGRKLKVYYNNSAMSADDISFEWDRNEVIVEWVKDIYSSNVDGYSRIDPSINVPPGSELIKTTYNDPITKQYKTEYYVYDTVKIRVSNSGLSEGYRIGDPFIRGMGYRVINMTNVENETFVINVDVEATFIDTENQYLGKRWVMTSLDIARNCVAGTVFAPPTLPGGLYGQPTLDIPTIPVPPEINGFVFTGRWVVDFADPKSQYINSDYQSDIGLIGRPGVYKPEYIPAPGSETVTYYLGSGGTTTDTTSFNLLDPNSGAPIAPTVIPKEGYIFVGWKPKIEGASDTNPVYEAVYEQVLVAKWLPPISLDNFSLNINATLPMKFTLNSYYEDVQLIVKELESEGIVVELKHNYDEEKGNSYMGHFRPLSEGNYIAQVLINGEVVMDKEFEVYVAGKTTKELKVEEDKSTISSNEKLTKINEEKVFPNKKLGKEK